MEEQKKENHGHEQKHHHDNKNNSHNAHSGNSMPPKAVKSNPEKFWKITTVVLIALLAIAVFRPMGTTNTLEAPAPTGGTPNPPGAPTVNMEELLDDDAVKGDDNAPVTIIEWSDYECPFCAKFYRETLSLIDEKYIKTGKVKLIFRDFPLSFHPNAQKAAEAAECAGEQGKYYDMHDLLFENGASGGVASYKQYATQLGLDTAAFNECLDSGSMAQEVQADMAAGQAAGIRGTPGFVINGRTISGAQPFSVFEQIIEAELNS